MLSLLFSDGKYFAVFYASLCARAMSFYVVYCAMLCSNALHCTARHYNPPHYSTPQYIHYYTIHYTILHYTVVLDPTLNRLMLMFVVLSSNLSIALSYIDL